MFKKILSKFFALTLCAILLTQSAAALAHTGSLDLDRLDKGSIGYHFNTQSTKKYKLLIKKQKVSYFYDVSGGSKEFFTLQMGNGNYDIVLYENVSGTKYRVVQTDSVTLALQKEEEAFLGSVQNIQWSAEDIAIEKAAQLTYGLKTDSDKIMAVYNYIINNIAYDNKKAKNVATGYLPDINDTYNRKLGICYDYSSLFAAMLRSVGIPTKLVMGKSSFTGNQYHAWNEVYDSSAKKWIIVDTTTDASLKKASKRYSFEKKSSDYKTDKVY